MHIAISINKAINSSVVSMLDLRYINIYVTYSGTIKVGRDNLIPQNKAFGSVVIFQ